MSGLFTAFISMVVELPLVLGYLKGQAFHQPFTPEEEKVMIERFLAGDLSARDELIERNMRLVAHVVKKFHPKHELLDDYISIGTIGLMKAVNSYTPTKKTKLATYAARCIENEILMYLRSLKKVQKDVSLHEPIGMDKDGHSLEITDLLQGIEKSTDEQLVDQEDMSRLYKHLGNLEKRELEIIVRRYGLLGHLPMTQKEISKQLKISRSYVSRIEKRALVKLYQSYIHEKNSLDATNTKRA
ncbi:MULTISPECIES: RNA polymerase sporulation sigma factor SigK [Bacillaceae]|uniref:RNA polymerase sporulation sigma factor SigK n=1 Tax=Bacillaceae TaxID=186817 RepID=UPI0006ADB0F7|nr:MULTISPECIES: RNA polymerase sporulation sigma factor SigK [Bacillaceae]ALC88068.1 RNA polymerase subunit sigma-70 [Bacillus sp. FJAT-22090]KQL34456.1 RNA polymerase subunit sigma-70 [Psychrobacillus sp. FJAT-21963]MDF2066256.1 RNA polymerase sporulation sigma factor SigK [Bacillus sp. Cr_A10]